MSIYSHLFRYRPRPKRQPLEDFLSEALVDLLNRLHTSDQIEFISNVLFSEQSSQSIAGQSYIEQYAKSRLEWKTQTRIEGGIIDILLSIDGLPAIVIESKISSVFRKHQSKSQGPLELIERQAFYEVNRSQLHTYGNWLKNNRTNEKWKGALVILAHFTNVPDDFFFGDYGPAQRVYCRWYRIWEWTVRKSECQLADGSLLSQLINELSQFLKEENMAAEFATTSDLATAQLYVQSNSRLESTFELVSEKLRDFSRTLGAKRSDIYGMTFDTDGSLIWAWVYLKAPAEIMNKWHIVWGIAYPNNVTGYWKNCEPALPNVPYIFVGAIVYGGKPDLPIEKCLKLIPDGLSKDTTPGDTALISARPIHQLRQDPQQWAEDFAQFVLDESNKIRDLLFALAKNL